MVQIGISLPHPEVGVYSAPQTVPVRAIHNATLIIPRFL